MKPGQTVTGVDMADFVIPYDDSITKEEEDSFDSPLEYLNLLDSFNDAVRQCNRTLNILSTFYKNRVFCNNVKHDASKEFLAPIHVSEELHYDLTMSLEDNSKNIFVRVWEAIKNFFKRIYRWLFGFKSTTKRYFSRMNNTIVQLTKDIQEIEKTNFTDDRFDKQKFLDTKITLKIHELDVTIWGVVNLLHESFKKIGEYVRDPERNNEARLIELERDDSESSFRALLGVTMITNEKDMLAPSRMEILPVSDLYKDKHETCSSFDILPEHDVIASIRSVLSDLGLIIKDSLTLETSFKAIEESYETLDKELKAVEKERNMDYGVASRRTKALVVAKDHINKSKALLESFIFIFNIEVDNLSTIVKTLKSCMKR